MYSFTKNLFSFCPIRFISLCCICPFILLLLTITLTYLLAAYKKMHEQACRRSPEKDNPVEGDTKDIGVDRRDGDKGETSSQTTGKVRLEEEKDELDNIKQITGGKNRNSRPKNSKTIDTAKGVKKRRYAEENRKKLVSAGNAVAEGVASQEQLFHMYALCAHPEVAGVEMYGQVIREAANIFDLVEDANMPRCVTVNSAMTVSAAANNIPCFHVQLSILAMLNCVYHLM